MADLMTPGRLADLLDSQEFRALPFEQRQTVFENGTVEAHDHITQTSGWTPELWKGFGEAVTKRRGEIADSKTWGESAAGAAATVGRVIKDSAVAMGTMATGLSPVLPNGKPGMGVTFQVPGETLVPMLGANIAKLDESIANKRMGGTEEVEKPLNELKSKLLNGDFPLNDAKAFSAWLDEQNATIQNATRGYYTKRQGFGQEGVPEDVKATRMAAVDPWVKSNDLSNPENAKALQAFLRTRSDSAFDTLRQNLLRTPQEAGIDAQRSKLGTESKLAKALKPEVRSYIQEAADPMEITGTALAVASGGASLGLKGASKLRRAATLGAGVAGEVLSEQGSLLMDSPNATPEQRWQVVKDSLIGALGLAGAGAVGKATLDRLNAQPSATPLDTTAPQTAARTTSPPSPPVESRSAPSPVPSPLSDTSASGSTPAPIPGVAPAVLPTSDNQGTGVDAGIPQPSPAPLQSLFAQPSEQGNTPVNPTTSTTIATPVPPASQGPAAQPEQGLQQSDLRGIQGGALDQGGELSTAANNLPQGLPQPSSQGILDTSPTITGSNAQTGAEMPVPATVQGEGLATGKPDLQVGGGPGASSIEEWGTTRFGQRLAKAAPEMKGAWAREFQPLEYRKRTEVEWEQDSKRFVQAQGLGAAELVFDPDSGLEGSDRVALAGALLDEADRQAGAGNAEANGVAADLADWLSLNGSKAGQEVRAYGYLVKRDPRLVVEQFKRKRNEDLETQIKADVGVDAPVLADEVKKVGAEERTKAKADTEAKIKGSAAAATAERERADTETKKAKTVQDRADALLDQYARSQSDTLSWKGKKAPDALRALMREHISQGVPNFIERAMALGVDEITAERLMQVGTEETRRIEGIKTAARLEREALADQRRAESLVNQLATEFSDTLSPEAKQQKSAFAELVSKAKRQAVDGLQQKLEALRVKTETARQMVGLLDEYRRREQAVKEAKQRLAEAAMPEKLAAQRADLLAKEFSDTFSEAKKQQPAPVQALMNEAMKKDIPDLAQRLEALGVSSVTASQVSALIAEGRRREQAVKEAKQRMAEAERPENTARSAIDQMARQFSDTSTDAASKPDAVRQKIAEALRAEQPLDDLPAQFEALGVTPATAASLARLIDLGRKNAEAVAREKAGQRLITSLEPKVAKGKAKKLLPPLIDKLLEAERLGVLGRSEFLERYAETFGLPKLTPGMIERLTALAREVRQAPEGLPKMEKAHELQNELAVFGGVKARDAIMAAWYANLLSGVSTQGVNVWGGGWSLALRSMASGVANQMDAVALFQGLRRGASKGLAEARNAIQGGRVLMGGMDKLDEISALETLAKVPFAERTAGQKVATLLSAGPLGKYVFRTLAAMDGLFHGVAMEGRAHLAASRAVRAKGFKVGTPEYWKAIQDDLGLGLDTWKDAQERAALEAKEQKKDANWIKRRTWDIIEREKRDVGVRQEAKAWADQVTFRGEPKGLSGAFYEALTKVQNWQVAGVPFARPIVPFARVLANVFSMNLDLTPIGIIRGISGRHIGGLLDKDAHLLERWDARERLALGVMGSLGTVVLASLAFGNKDENDVDTGFMIYGAGPKSKALRDQMPKGWRPYTVKIGDKYWSYAETPMALMMTTLGAYMDANRYGKMKDEDMEARLQYGTSQIAGSLFSQGMLSSMGNLFEVLKGEKKMTSMIGNYTSGFIPGQGLLRDINTLFDPEKISATDVQTALLKDVPVIRGYIGNPDLNIWGEPVKLEGLPVVRRFVQSQRRDELTDWLTRQGLRVPMLPQSVEWAQFLTKGEKFAEKANRVEGGMLTTAERYQFAKRSGELLKERVQMYRQALDGTTPPPATVLQSRLEAMATAARRTAMRELVER